MVYSTPANVLRVSGITSGDVSDADLISFIAEADDYINNWTGKKFESTAVTEYFEGRSEEITVTNAVSIGQFSEETDEEKRVIVLSNYPVISITELVFLDDDGTDDGDALTEDTDFHLWLNIGKIRLITQSIPVGKGKKKVKVTYTYGTATVPTTVRELSATIAAIQALTNLSGGSYDDITSYRLGPVEVGVGEPYTNMRAAIKHLARRQAELFNALGRKMRTAVI